MSINVYWAVIENDWMIAKEPESLIKRAASNYFVEEGNDLTRILFCPAVSSSLKNTFMLKSLYDYNIKFLDNQIMSNYFNENFFNDHVLIRSHKLKMFSFTQKYIFFTDEPSLIARFNVFPYLEDNEISKRCMMPEGSYDIGKWFRNVDSVFYLKKDYEEFLIKKNDVFSYIKFETDDKINLKQFLWTPELERHRLYCSSLNNNRYLKTMKNYYSNFKNKKFIIKEIKSSLIN
jgi:hypothetical protein